MAKPLLFILILSITACAGLDLAPRSAQSVFIYDYTIPNATSAELWAKARDHFSISFGDAKKVIQSSDRETATITGKAVATWSLFGNQCATSYTIRFMAKDGRARLKLELLYGVPFSSACSGYAWPSNDGYSAIVASFNSSAKALESAIGSDSDFADF